MHVCVRRRMCDYPCLRCASAGVSVCGEPPQVQWLVRDAACAVLEETKWTGGIPAQRHAG